MGGTERVRVKADMRDGRRGRRKRWGKCMVDCDLEGESVVKMRWCSASEVQIRK